jgi:hypothetical protein
LGSISVVDKAMMDSNPHLSSYDRNFSVEYF